MGRKTQSCLNRTKGIYFCREREGDGETRTDKGELSQREQQKDTVGWSESMFPDKDSESN